MWNDENYDPNIKICGPKRNFSEYESATVKEILDYFEDKDQVEIDTETEGFDPNTKSIITLQLGDANAQFVVDVRSVNILRFKDLIEEKLCLLHNAKFDYKMLYKAGIVLDKVYDTMLGEIIIFNGFNDERGFKLNELVDNYLGIEMEKETRGTFSSLRGDPLKDRQIKYAGRDVAYLSRIKELQERFIKKYDLHFAKDLAMETLKCLGDMELNGIYLDEEEWTKVAREKQKELINVEHKMDRYLVDQDIRQPSMMGQDLFGTPTRVLDINYGSPQQVLEVIKELGIEATDTSARTLNKLKDEEFIKLLLEHRSFDKKVSTYGKPFLKYINKATGRVHTDFWQIKSTYRLGSGNKQQNAPNMQNIPKDNEYRNCFKPREGYSWVSIDYASQELRIMADKAGEGEFINALQEGKDLHCFAYNKMTGDNITKEDKDKRQKAKVINYGKPYGMSPYKLSDQLQIPIEEAEEMFDLYAKAFPDLETWLQSQANFGNSKGYILVDPRHKGRRWFPEFKELQKNQYSMGWKEKNKLKGIIARASMNTPIQGAAATQTKEAMVDIRKWLIDTGYWQDEVYMICQVHDELNFEVKDELVDEVVPKLEEMMNIAANRYLSLIEMDTDTTITKQWEK